MTINTRLIRVLLIFSFSCLEIIAYSQTLFFSTLTTLNGLPSNNINCIAQDKNNFIWVGTDNGLCRYDGYRFKVFKNDGQSHSIPVEDIICLLVDGDFLWVGTRRGVFKLNTITFEVIRIEIKNAQYIRAFHKDSDKNIWIGTLTGLFKYTPLTQQVKSYSVAGNNLSHNTIRAIYEDKQNNLWVGTYDKLNKLAPGSEKFETFDLKGKYKPALKNNLICDIKPVHDSDSLLWVGTETGLCLFNKRNNTFKHFTGYNTKLSNEVVKNVYEDKEGNLWLGTDFGLNIFNPSSQKNITYFHNPQVSYSIANNVIWETFEDSGGLLWFVTSAGLSRINTHFNFYNYHEITHNIGGQTIGSRVRSIIVTKKGILWIATLNGVIRLDPATNKQKVFNINSDPKEQILLNNVFTIEEDDHERIWIGTGAGINVWDEPHQKMYSITATKTNGLLTNYTAKFTKGTDGSFWINFYDGGFFKVADGFEDLENIRFEFVADLGEMSAYALNAIWTIYQNNLYRIDPITYSPQLIKNFAAVSKGRNGNGLYYAPRGSIWVGAQNGLIEYNPHLDTTYFHPVITGNDTEISNIISDDIGNIWGTANNLILKFSLTDHHVEIFPLDKDLPLKTFAGFAAKTTTGDIIFGGDNGFISLSPRILPAHYQPHVYLTSIEINNKVISPRQEVDDKILLNNDIAFTKELELEYDQRSIVFEFGALHYWQPDMNVYGYMLEGFDKEWNYVSGLKNFAVYSNLSPGTYTLKVKGTNNYGMWSDHTTMLKIIIKPHLFLSPLFLALYALLVIIIVFIAFRIYLTRVHLRNELKIALLEKDHAEEIVQTKQHFFTNISHELRTPISLIIPPLQQIMKSGTLNEENKNLITLAEKNSQRLLRLINQILAFRKLEHENPSLKISWFDLVPLCAELYPLFSDKAGRSEIDFTFHSTQEECLIWADKEKIEAILFNLLSNAFKFTPRGGKIKLSLELGQPYNGFESNPVEIKVWDSGIIISPEEQAKIFGSFYQSPEAKKMENSSGIGLTLVAEYTKLHKGEIKVASTKETGTCFTLLLPLGNSHFPEDTLYEKEEIAMPASRKVNRTTVNRHSAGHRSSRPMILIVEDNTDMSDFIKLCLKDKYDFITAENGEAGVAKAQDFLPEVIVSDIMMPTMDGIEFCRQMKKDNRTSHIPIILLTAKNLTSQKIDGIRNGADIYLTKPFEIELLEVYIDHLLQRNLELAAYFRNELITQPVFETSKENEDEKFLKKVMNTIEANISNPDFSVELLSDKIGMSSTHLYRKLKLLTHISANEIIKKYRIKKASLLLKNKEGNISEIMYEVGFSNLSYFSKCFKSEFGLAPKEFQQKMSKHDIHLDDKIMLNDTLKSD
jgi:signal transduction histidine kinase/ligand-binding sensor domain-containing protein/DNA-binding response OmpR family regulator